MSYAEKVLFLTQYLQATNAEQFPDSYASLRHALFLADRLLSDEPLGPDARLDEIDAPGDDDLRRTTGQEYGWACNLRRGATIPAELLSDLHHKARAALLRGIVRAGARVDPALLLDQVGISNTLDSLVRDALALHQQLPASFPDALRDAFERHLSPQHMRPLTTLLDIAAARDLPMLDSETVNQLLPRWDSHERLSIALIRYAAALGMKQVVPLLEEMLVSCGGYTFAQRFAVVDALVRLAGEESVPMLEAAGPELSRGPDGRACSLFQERLEATVASVRAEPSLLQQEGLVVAQFMFQGSIGQAGKGNSGGLGVFLASLGDALGDVPGIAHVVTLVLLTPSQALANPPLAIQRTAAHTVLHVPICCRDALTQYQLMVQEEEIKTALTRVLEIHGVRPDVVHLRYADHGSRAAARVAQDIGARIVFTLTADPHRRLTDAFTEERVKGLEAKALTFDLHRVYIADQLLEMADALVAMPTSQGTAPLKAYFPQLVLAPQGQQPKPLHAIAEGIQLLRDVAPEPDPAAMRSLLNAVGLQPGSDRDATRPIMLSVGRLNPVKQQDLLVQAWAAGGLADTYDLVLIGGNTEAPTSVERRMQDQIATILAAHPGARPHFWLLPAMPNARVRRLEQAIILAQPAPTPHIYVCPSVKEEFGIAVLEAMDAGFLVVGPVVGGLSSYITPGENGFLMETNTPATIAAVLRYVVSNHTSEQLATIAEAGACSVQAQFDIRTTAAAFAEVYR
ncbi:MAG: glycosyltransferase family 4 protein [Anaerolineae bacterium]|nr:glycosyltransferase family 4 protein [Anaerolineae bacterium]